MVYFVFSPDDPRSLVKIGYTAGDAEARIKALQIGIPFRLCLIMGLDGGKKLERQLHRRFRHARVHGEWFLPTEDLRRFIADCLGDSLRRAAERMRRDGGEVAWLAATLGWTEAEVAGGLAALAV